MKKNFKVNYLSIFKNIPKLKGIKVLNLDNYYVQDYKKNKNLTENDYHLNEYGHNFIAEILYKGILIKINFLQTF